MIQRLDKFAGHGRVSLLHGGSRSFRPLLKCRGTPLCRRDGSKSVWPPAGAARSSSPPHQDAIHFDGNVAVITGAVVVTNSSIGDRSDSAMFIG